MPFEPEKRERPAEETSASAFEGEALDIGARGSNDADLISETARAQPKLSGDPDYSSLMELEGTYDPGSERPAMPPPLPPSRPGEQPMNPTPLPVLPPGEPGGSSPRPFAED